MCYVKYFTDTLLDINDAFNHLRTLKHIRYLLYVGVSDDFSACVYVNIKTLFCVEVQVDYPHSPSFPFPAPSNKTCFSLSKRNNNITVLHKTSHLTSVDI